MYDILRKHPDGIFIWVESGKDLETVKERLKQLASLSPGEYLALRQDTREVVIKEISRAAAKS